MTINEARKILGKNFRNYSDDEILTIVKEIKKIADVCAEIINNKIENKGNNFLYMESKR